MAGDKPHQHEQVYENGQGQAVRHFPADQIPQPIEPLPPPTRGLTNQEKAERQTGILQEREAIVKMMERQAHDLRVKARKFDAEADAIDTMREKIEARNHDS